MEDAARESVATEAPGTLPLNQVLVAQEVPAGWSLHVRSREYAETLVEAISTFRLGRVKVDKVPPNRLATIRGKLQPNRHMGDAKA